MNQKSTLASALLAALHRENLPASSITQPDGSTAISADSLGILRVDAGDRTVFTWRCLGNAAGERRKDALEAINRYNRTALFARAFIDDDGEIILSAFFPDILPQDAGKLLGKIRIDTEGEAGEEISRILTI